MYDLLLALSWQSLALLCFSLFLVLFFEFINGFHDTANAVATVIYTQSLSPWRAVAMSGLFNFLGVITGGLAVAYAIVHLLPVDILTSGDSRGLIAMIFAILIGAIVWNLGTWYFGLPASSSHTLIGSIVGVGIIHAYLTGTSVIDGINWDKAIDVGLSLLLSPISGFFLAFALLWLVRKYLPTSKIHQTPHFRSDVKGRKHPPFWTRVLLIISSACVSFAHGSNDGQKGIGLMMLTLICLLPTQFLINTHADRYQLERSLYASQQLALFAEENQAWISQQFPPHIVVNNANHCQVSDIQKHFQQLNILSFKNPDIQSLNNQQRWQVRRSLLCLASSAKLLADNEHTDPAQQEYLKKLYADLNSTTEYAPLWVIFAIASALGLGTMIGWKRVVKTVGEGIGKEHMTYAQGLCAQVTTAAGIAVANVAGLPVSTTQILSSAVAGAAVADKSGLKVSTIRNILLAWVFTFPAAMVLAGAIYYVIALMIK
ncbi:MAG: inorganic phosphate transporter [Neisseriaceae bacterium]|nr:inorganic phosphate transporter [Neisseriaceae bacterium]